MIKHVALEMFGILKNLTNDNYDLQVYAYGYWKHARARTGYVIITNLSGSIKFIIIGIINFKKKKVIKNSFSFNKRYL